MTSGIVYYQLECELFRTIQKTLLGVGEEAFEGGDQISPLMWGEHPDFTRGVWAPTVCQILNIKKTEIAQIRG